MRISIIVSIARTHLLSRKRQTIIAALGVTFGIGMFIGMVGLMTGINKFLEELMLENTAHVHLFRDPDMKRASLIEQKITTPALLDVRSTRPKDTNRNIRGGKEILNIIKKDPHVSGASPLLVAQVFYNNGATPVNGSVSGVDILEYDKLFNFKTKMEQGEITGLLTVNNGILLGNGLAEKLNVSLSDQIQITTTTGRQLNLMVVGIFSTGIAAIDNASSFSSLQTVQRIMGKNGDYFTDIKVRLNDIRDSKKMATEWKALFGYEAQDWKKANAEVLVGFTMRNTITVAVSIALLIVAAFGIYNILTMMIYEKMRDIAILNATGFTGRDIRFIFISEALIIGMIGGLSGLLFGFLLSLGLNSIPLSSEQLKSVTHLPVNFDIQYYVFGLFFALLTTFFAGWFPARKASGIDPVEIIRGK
jgi:lipoprotein-releasing system permease protein